MSHQVDQAVKTEFCNYVASYYACDFYTTEAGKIKLADTIQFYEKLVAQHEAKGNQEAAEMVRPLITKSGITSYPLFANGAPLTTAQVFEHFDAFYEARYNGLGYTFDGDTIDREAFRDYFERKLGFEEQSVDKQ